MSEDAQGYQTFSGSLQLKLKNLEARQSRLVLNKEGHQIGAPS